VQEREMRIKLEDKIPDIIKILLKGKDCEIRKSANGVSIAEISKKIVAR